MPDNITPTTQAVTTPAPPIDVAKRTQQYIQLRDKIDEINKRHEEELKPFKEMKAKLDGMLLDYLNTHNMKSAKAEGVGTITATDRKSATVADADAFRLFVTTQAMWDLADLRANAPAVAEYIAENAVEVPGVKLTMMRTLSVRRSS
jgi:hypothetical protein